MLMAAMKTRKTAQPKMSLVYIFEFRDFGVVVFFGGVVVGGVVFAAMLLLLRQMARCDAQKEI